ncbi:MAG TPA: hypothetical protein VK172_06055 [Lentimicrobium sp.]|nr:hypothetical protein [Lentimicrobium sp.]
MNDAQGLEKEIQAIDKPEHKNLVKLAKDYHKKVCTLEECTVYEKSKLKVHAKIEGLSGIDYVLDEAAAIKVPYFINGAINNFWLPRVNEKLYLRTGIFYERIEQEKNMFTNSIRFPFQIEYIAPDSHRLRPNIAIGLLSPNYTAGIMVKINKKVSAGIETWANFYSYNSLFFVPYTIKSYYLLGAIYLDL